MLTQSREHLRRNGMTYTDHMRFASFYGVVCIWSGLLLLAHALVPGWFQQAGRTLVRRLGESFGREEEHDATSNAHVRAA
jgi:hypothetical protein